MPTSSKKPPPVLPPAADVPPELNSFIIELAERVGQVEEGQTELAGRVGQVEDKLDKLQGVMQQNSQMLAEVNLMQHKVLIAVQGQRDPGLEVPGLTDTVKKLQGDLAADRAANAKARDEDCARMSSLEAWKNRVLWTAGGITIIGGPTLFFFGDKLSLIISVLSK